MSVVRIFFALVLAACAGGAVSSAQTGPGNGNQAGGDEVLSQRQVARKAKLKSRPAPDYPGEAVTYNAGAVVRLRVILRASGAVTGVSVMKVALSKGAPTDLADAFIREAVEAARKIKFEPAVKDGKPVSQYLVLEYAFNR
ncbi:MAG TPA: energy transducer TonB [Pyrinomonadaceae bacterium]|jgi:TonB family protein